ncbi:MAG: hypothetical protein ACRC4P_10140, partial [Aeromonas sp.]
MPCSGLLSFFSIYASFLESEDDLGLDSARVEEQAGLGRWTQGLEQTLERAQGLEPTLERAQGLEPTLER